MDRVAALEQRVATVEALLAGINAGQRAAMNEQPLQAIIADAAFLMGLRVSEILSERRFPILFRARCAIVWVALLVTDYSMARMGRVMGRIDHSSVIHQRNRAEILRAADPAFRVLTDKLLVLAEDRDAA